MIFVLKKINQLYTILVHVFLKMFLVTALEIQCIIDSLYFKIYPWIAILKI